MATAIRHVCTAGSLAPPAVKDMFTIILQECKQSLFKLPYQAVHIREQS